MSDRDPSIMSYPFDPATSDFAPGGTQGNRQQNGSSGQVSAPPSTYFEARILNLEEEHASLREDINTLNELYHGLSSSVGDLKKGGWPVHVGRFQNVDLTKSHQTAVEFRDELERLSREVHASFASDTDQNKADGRASPQKNGSMPPHMRADSVTSNVTPSRSLPPHLRGSNMAGISNKIGTPKPPAEVTSKTLIERKIENKVPVPAPSPPESLKTAVACDGPTVQDLSLNDRQEAWQPHFIRSLPALPADVLSKISTKNTVTFHPAFLQNTLGGTPWSPGLRFIKRPGACMLKKRTYYELDPATEPFLPLAPGKHGAKLTAFFNKSPEEDFGELLGENTDTYKNVPMFVMEGNRYVYYGNYTQSRWSDKVGFDTMSAQVPQNIKEYWAHELTATPREDWVTEALKKHFFPKPEYEGRLYAAPSDETTVNSEDEVQLNEQMTKDVKKYIAELREWDREANMKTAMMKKQDILNAFESADIDEPPAMRLWWEYLECVDWKKDFYDLLVTLQSRDPDQYLE